MIRIGFSYMRAILFFQSGKNGLEDFLLIASVVNSI